MQNGPAKFDWQIFVTGPLTALVEFKCKELIHFRLYKAIFVGPSNKLT